MKSPFQIMLEKVFFMATTSLMTSQYDFEYFLLYLCLRVSQWQIRISVTDTNITMKIIWWTYLEKMSTGKTYQDRRSRVKVTDVPNVLDTKTAVPWLILTIST